MREVGVGLAESVGVEVGLGVSEGVALSVAELDGVVVGSSVAPQFG